VSGPTVVLPLGLTKELLLQVRKWNHARKIEEGGRRQVEVGRRRKDVMWHQMILFLKIKVYSIKRNSINSISIPHDAEEVKLLII